MPLPIHLPSLPLRLWWATWMLALLAVAASLLGGCAPKPPPQPVVPAVFVSPVRNDSGSQQRSLFGSLRPRLEAELAFRTGGKVTARLVELGQAVRAGQAVARLDPADYQLAVQAAAEQQRAAEVDAVQAASDAARFKRLLADGSVGAADAERQQARADAAAARLTQARQQTALASNRAGYAVLAAPFDGVVTAIRFEAGQVVGEGQAVLSLAKHSDLEVQVDVPEALAEGLKAWQASVRLHEAQPALPLPLRLRELAPSANAATRTFRARYALPPAPPGASWRMGQSAQVQLTQAASGAPGAELPLGALLVTPSATGGTSAAAVWLVDAQTGALQRQPVQLLSQTTDTVRLAGLRDGALVVSAGAQKLDAGLKVRPVQRPLAALALTTPAGLAR